MVDETARKRNMFIAIVALAVVLLVIIITVVVLFLAKPLGFQYENASTQAKSVKLEQQQAMNSVTAYFDALHEGKDTKALKEEMSQKAGQLQTSVTRLGEESAVVRDEEVQQVYKKYQQDGQRFATQVQDVVKTIDATESLREACGTDVFDGLAAAQSREAGWRVFEACASTAGSFNPNDLPDADYRILFLNMKKTFVDTQRWLTEDESIYDDVMVRLSTLSMAAESTDTTVHDRLRESASTQSLSKLEALLKKKQEA